ncbi:MAG: hypothetical protein ABSF67_10885 [Roseiarcus sp.]|jgi:hypothetical protein
MSSKFRLAPAIAITLVGALAFSTAPTASAMTSYASPAILKSAAAPSAQPVAYRYHHWRHGYYYGGGAAFAAAAFGMIAALAATSSYDCDWGACGDYNYDYGGPYYGYGGPYYGGWGGYHHWQHWSGHAWHGGDRHVFANGGGRRWWPTWRH